jgi:RND superfamily putative drug exporter
MTPALAALLGRWFWWPMVVRPRPASAMLRPYGTRPSVRELLHENDDVDAETELGSRRDIPTA